MEPIKFWIDDEPIPPPMSAFLWPIEIVIPAFVLMIDIPKGLDFFEDQRKPLASDCIINASLHD